MPELRWKGTSTVETLIVVVPAKLRPPIAPKNIIKRTRLLEALNRITEHRLTVVCAGPGYGKTTLLASITSHSSSVVWYSLSQSDQDLAVFVTYLIEGIRQYFPQFGSTITDLIFGAKVGAHASSEAIASHIVNALGAIDARELIIVLDDLHYVDRSQAIQRLLDTIILHLPQNIRLVFASRRPPRLPSLPRLRMIGEVNEIAEEDLRFNVDEVQQLLREIYGLEVDEEIVKAVIEQTEGWAIGLQLAGQSLSASRGKNAAALLTDLGGNKERLFEYLAEEVFKRQPANVQRFLRETSVLSTLSIESCDAIFGRSDSARMFDHIEQNNLFAVKVHDGCWRYHHLFRDFLRQQASKEPEYLKHLHRRAAIYFEERENHVQAIQHYLFAEHFADAIRLISKIGPAMFTASRFDTLTFWIGQIPQRELEKAPDVLLLQGQVLDAQGHYDLALEWLERAMHIYADRKDGIGLSKVLNAKAYIALWRLGRNTEAAALYREVLDLLPPENRVERADLLRGLSLTHLCEGNRAAAEEAYAQALKLYEEAGDVDGTLATLIIPGTWIFSWRGDFADAIASLQRALNLAEQLNSRYWLGECLCNMSPMLRFSGRCLEAKARAEEALAISHEIGSVQLEGWSLAHIGLAHDGWQVPDLHAGRRFLQEAARLAERTGTGRLLIRALNSDALILRRLGDTDEAAKAINRALSIVESSADQLLIASTKMQAGAVLTGRDTARAQDFLLQARRIFARYGDKFDLTRVNLYLAALYLQAKPREALECFKTSLDLARENGYEFWLIEERAATAPLLALAAERSVDRDYCERLLAEIGVDGTAAISPPNDQAISVASNILADPCWSDGAVVSSNSLSIQKTRASNKASELLRIRCLGNFQVRVGDRLVQEREWQRKDAKSLLKYLAAAPDHTAAREEVVELLWGDMEPEVARSRLSKALYLLRRILEPHARSYYSSYIESGQGLLVLRREMVDTVDIDEFLQHINLAQQAERTGLIDHAIKEYETAEVLYAGDFLADDPYEEWTIAKREYFRSLYISLLEKLAKWHFESQRYESATLYLQKILVQDQTREDVHVTLMRCLARMGRRKEALAQYAICRKALKEELDLDPAQDTQALYIKLLEGKAV